MAGRNQETQMEASWTSCALWSMVFIETVKNECDMSGHDKAMEKTVFSQQNINDACALHKESVTFILCWQSCDAFNA